MGGLKDGAGGVSGGLEAFIEKKVEELEAGAQKPTDIKEDFKPASTIAEADAYAMDTLGIPNASYKGLDLAVANEFNQCLREHFAQFPEMKENFGFVGSCQERNRLLELKLKQTYLEAMLKANPDATPKMQKKLEAMASKRARDYVGKYLQIDSTTGAQHWPATGDVLKEFRGISINQDFGENLNATLESLRNDVQSNLRPNGCTSLRSLLDHEMGHSLDKTLGIGALPAIQKLYDGRSQKELTRDLSKYSWDNANANKYSEMVAEGWAEYCNNPNPREVAKTIGETIKAEYTKKFSLK